MTMTYLRGPDAQRLLSSLAVNSFETFGVGRSRHFVCCSPDGYLIGDGILYTIAPEEMVLVGRAAGHNWVRFCAETGGWDVSVEADEIFSHNPAGRRTVYRYQVEGPHARSSWNGLPALLCPRRRGRTSSLSPSPAMKGLGPAAHDGRQSGVRVLRTLG